jgi:hypothetical protein
MNILNAADSREDCRNSETILPNDDPNLAKCTKNGVFTKFDAPNLLAK